MSVLGPSLEFALEYRDQVFPGVPIVFMDVDEQEVQKHKLPADVIGVPVKLDPEVTLEVALRFHPKTRRVFVITGSAAFDVYWEGVARRTSRPYEGRIEFVYRSEERRVGKEGSSRWRRDHEKEKVTGWNTGSS